MSLNSISRPRQIGFVLRIYPPVPTHDRRNWVRFARLPSGRATPNRLTAFFHILQSPQVWVRFAQFPPSAPPPGGNWVRFARFDPKLGSFCTFRLRHSPAGGVLQSAIRNHQSAIESPAPQIGFVLHLLLSRPSPEGPGLRVPPARMSLRGVERRSNLNRGSWGCTLPTMPDPSNVPFVACCLRLKARCSVVAATQ